MRLSRKTKKDLIAVLLYVVALSAILSAVFFTPDLLNLLRSGEKTVVLSGTPAFKQFMENESATLQQIRDGSKALDFHAVNLPEDLSDLNLPERTSQFITLILSHALKCREKILADRKQLLLYIVDTNKGRKISRKRKAWYRRLAAHYRMPKAKPEKLLQRVDAIPISLTIAQAITESGWGTSRFAQKANALYGQHLPENSTGRFITSYYGEVKVAAFDSVLQATASYMHTINTSRAYASFRTIRRTLRQEGKTPDGYTLAAGLLNYSEIGEDYIANLRYLIELYGLEALDKTKLQTKKPAVAIRFLRGDAAAKVVQSRQGVKSALPRAAMSLIDKVLSLKPH
jgi:Bax protein